MVLSMDAGNTLNIEFDMHLWYLKGKKYFKIGIEGNFFNLMNGIQQNKTKTKTTLSVR